MDKIFFVISFVLLFTVIAVISSKIRKKNAGYDERQEKARGNAYKVGFLASLVVSGLYLLLGIVFEALISYSYVWIACSLFFGIGAFAISCIWQDAFFSVKQKPTYYLVFCFAVTAINGYSFYETVLGKTSFLDVLLSYNLLNLLCAVVFLVIGINIVAKLLLDRRETE